MLAYFHLRGKIYLLLEAGSTDVYFYLYYTPLYKSDNNELHLPPAARNNRAHSV